MDDKYYTPQLNEFHVGFKYEYKYFSSNWEKAEVTIETFSNDSDGEVFYDHPLCENSIFRVKKLDHDDIIKLGWEISIGQYYPNNGKIKCYSLKAYELEFEQKDTENILIEIGEDNPVFKGTVKNFNELQKIMHMIGI
jgi:hypothetical protein